MQADFYILVTEGLVQRYVSPDDGSKYMLVARTHEDGVRLAKWCHQRFGKRVSVAKIGSLEDPRGKETLENHLRLALEEGCVGVITPFDGWNSDGSPERWATWLFGASEGGAQ